MHTALRAIGLLLLAAALTAAARDVEPARSLPAPLEEPGRLRPMQNECSERVGPFATQGTAWDNQRQAQAQGYGVSGVFPCYDGSGYRGYCFNVFYPC
jgi:hypothetical protein